MKDIVKIIFVVFSLLFLIYLWQPNFDFPEPPSDALQSQEPGDTETDLRRAYFTNYTREEVVKHYQEEFEKDFLFGLYMPSYRLNYPPEEAGTLIRDQTRSTFLEEIVHPLRESVYVNGFQAKEEKDTILIDGRVWNLKITVRYVQSSRWLRLLIGMLIVVMTPVLFWQLRIALSGFKRK